MKPMEVDLNIHSIPYLDTKDKCYYFVDLVKGGYQASYENSIVYNFKKI